MIILRKVMHPEPKEDRQRQILISESRKTYVTGLTANSMAPYLVYGGKNDENSNNHKRRGGGS